MKNDNINFDIFRKEWCDAMVYTPKKFKEGFDQFLQDQYVIYKDNELGYRFIDVYSVKEFCEFFYLESDLDTHPYMIKSKAFDSKHVQGLIDLIKRRR